MSVSPCQAHKIDYMDNTGSTVHQSDLGDLNHPPKVLVLWVTGVQVNQSSYLGIPIVLGQWKASAVPALLYQPPQRVLPLVSLWVLVERPSRGTLMNQHP